MDEPSAWTVGPCGLDLLNFKEFSEIFTTAAHMNYGRQAIYGPCEAIVNLCQP